jgi:hypothetical protein
MGPGGDLYKIVFMLHILSLIFGFGPLVLTGLYAVMSQRRGAQSSREVGEVHFAVTQVAEKVVYLVFVFGVLLVLLSDGAWSLGDFWVSTAMVSFIAAMGISHGVLVPNEKRMNVLRNELADLDGVTLSGPPEQAVELQDRAKRAAAMGTTLNLVLVFILYLMVFKPGA